ncbi:TetR/AcrR family transcriptional regulator [Amycolatopsis mediterranei]|uniref:TetR/AcrR family transcriptional regulator n=1 Tax=Amycolatopsis mediterranei TaxID=33910 RepID=UPI00343CFD02
MARRTPPAGGRIRTDILAATRRLLDTHAFTDIGVADILREAGIARGSFYFYFARKQDVLAELMRTAIATGHEAARENWLADDGVDRRAAVHASIVAGARLWAEQAPVLRAVVEQSHVDPEIGDLWRDLMGTFVTATASQIDAERAAGVITTDLDSETLAATLTWLGERLYYLAAKGVPPFDDQEKLVDTLTHTWMSVLYN